MSKEMEIPAREKFRFFLPVRVHYADTDAQRVVYYGSHFTYMEAANQEYWHRMGIKLNDLFDQGLVLSIVEARCRYLSPGFYDDMLDVYVRMPEMRNRSFDLDYLIVRRKDDITIAVGKTVFVIVGEDWKPKQIPDWFRKAVESFEKA